MTVPTIFETSRPREDVLKGAFADADFAADLAQVVAGRGDSHYLDPASFFAQTYPTRGLRNLLANIGRRLSGEGGEAAALFRLDTSYGGGKTHALIALTHMARGMQGVDNVAEFIEPALVPQGPVRVAAFDGENADPANGRAMGDGVLARTPWGEIAYSLAGREGYERLRGSDEQRIAPGAETLRELFGGEPVLILLDELSVYLRKVRRLDDAHDQLTAFLTSLFKAVEGAPKAALVYTLAIGKDGRAVDAYGAENQFIVEQMAEAESVSARKATLLNPTEEDETVQVLRRRLFETIDETQIPVVVEAYRSLWTAHGGGLSEEAGRPGTAETFQASYPLHPEVLETLTGKTATLANFQRVRGMLRLLARTVALLWESQPKDATAIHLHHIDPGSEPIRQEIVTRLQQDAFTPAIANDVTGGSRDKPALAEDIDARDHKGMPPYAGYVARTVLMHTFAFNDPLKGLLPEQLRYSVLGPALDVSFVEEARRKFISDSAYLDDRPGAPMRFLAEANLSQIVRRAEQQVEPGDARAHLDDRIREIFRGPTFDAVPFPGGPFDVPDEVGDGRPKLVLLSYDSTAVGNSVETVPELVERIYSRKGSEGSALRLLLNHLVFVVADEARVDDMKRLARRRLALQDMKKPERIADLAEHQQARVREWESRSEQELANAVQQCYRHLFYPSRDRVGGGSLDLAHSAIDTPSTSDRPGAGQQQVVRALRELSKLRLSEDEPDSPAYVRDRTPLKRGQISTGTLRDEFRRDPALPMLWKDDVFLKGVRRGIEEGAYVYRRGDLLYGPGDPQAHIAIDEQSHIFTMAYAKSQGIWPRPEKPETTDTTDTTDKTERDDPTREHDNGLHERETPEAFSAEAPLREALTKLWEQLRAKKVERLGSLTIRMFEAGDGFRLLGAVGAVSGAEKLVKIEGGYETRDGSTFEIGFQGSVQDAQPVREFLEPQVRDATDRDLKVRFELTFGDGLAMAGDAPETLAARLVRFATTAAHVSATSWSGD